MRRILIGMTLVLVGAIGCRTESLPRHPRPLPSIRGKAPFARASRIADPDQRLEGPMASGRRGDFRLETNHLAVVIAGIGRTHGGAIVDGVAAGGKDPLRSLAPVVGRGQLRRPLLERLELEELGGTFSIRVKGVDATNPKVRVTHTYTCVPGSRVLRITTMIHNRDKQALLQYRVGDRVDWGTAVAFAPGLGRSPRGTPALPWLSAWSGGASYAYFRRSGSFSATLEGQTATTVLETLEIPPGQRVSVQRLLAIGAGGQMADLLPVILKHQGITSCRASVSVSTDTGDPLPRADVVIRTGERPFALARTGEDGTATLHLPPNRFNLHASTVDRRSPASTITVRPGVLTPVTLRTGPPSRLVFDVREEGATAPFPVKLTLVGTGGTPTPWLGPPFTRRAGSVVLSAGGKGIVPLPPGRYRVIASRGPEFSLHGEEVTLKPHTGASLVARLTRVVDTRGYLGVDLGQWTRRSPGSGVTVDDRLLSNQVEGLDAAVLLDAGGADAKAGR